MLNAIIPFYNSYVLCEIVGLSWYWFVLMLLPTIFNIFGILGILLTIGNLVGFIANANVYYNLAKKFNKDNVWVVFTLFFSFITIPILGYSSNDKYENVPTKENGFLDNLFGSNSSNNNNNQNNSNVEQNTDNQNVNDKKE